MGTPAPQGGCGHRVDCRRHLPPANQRYHTLCCVIRQLNDVTRSRYVPHHGMVVLSECTTQLCTRSRSAPGRSGTTTWMGLW
jgi:hypothetical protein